MIKYEKCLSNKASLEILLHINKAMELLRKKNNITTKELWESRDLYFIEENFPSNSKMLINRKYKLMRNNNIIDEMQFTLKTRKSKKEIESE